MSMTNTNSDLSKSYPWALAVLVNNQEKHYIYEDKIVIGRSPTANICLKEIFISRQHCTIERTADNKFLICDLSISGTYVNGKKLTKNQPEELNSSDCIKLADQDTHSYKFSINKKLLNINTPRKVSLSGSPLAEEMIDLNQSQCLEKESMDKELNMVESELLRLKEELQENLKSQRDELEKEKLKASMESDYNKEQAEIAKTKLKETIEEKEQVVKEFQSKIADFTKKEEELQKTKNEMEKRHKLEREELESKLKTEIEDLKQKLEKSELQQQQCEELQNKLKEIKGVLMESELEQERLFEAKVEVEAKLESKIIDLTTEGENKSEQLKELEIKLREKEELEEKVKKEIVGLEDDMMCSICAEFYIEPTALNCGHMFCKMCITEWSKKKKICPMCRAKITSTVRIFNMDSVIQRNIRLMSDEVQSRRQAIIEERKRGKTPLKKQPPKKRRREVPPVAALPADPMAALGVHLRPPNPTIFQTLFQPHHVHFADVEFDMSGDPFGHGWVAGHQHMRHGSTERYSPVPVAAVDLTTSPTNEASTARRSHTVTSAQANTTIDLTYL